MNLLNTSIIKYWIKNTTSEASRAAKTTDLAQFIDDLSIGFDRWF